MRFAVAVVIATCAFAGVAHDSAGAATPALHVAPGTSLTVLGSGFSAHEPVRVTVVARERMTRRVRVSRTGRFAARFGIPLDTCSGAILIRAAGPRSGLVRVKLSLRGCPELEIP
jgi:hypothetical protein